MNSAKLLTRTGKLCFDLKKVSMDKFYDRINENKVKKYKRFTNIYKTNEIVSLIMNKNIF